MRPEEIDEEARQDALFDPPEVEVAPDETAPDPAADAWTTQDDPDYPDPAPVFDPPEPLKRRAIDDAVLDVLREEAERDAAARRAEAAPLETQPDLGLDAAPPAMDAAPAATEADEAPPAATLATATGLSAAARRIARMKGIDPDASPPPPPGKAAKGRDLLPDIEEINSTLAPDEDRQDGLAHDPSMQPVSPPRSGFRTGFTLMVVLALLALAAYVMAPRLAEQIPALRAPLDQYTALVDGLRAWLDQWIQRLGSMIGAGG